MTDELRFTDGGEEYIASSTEADPYLYTAHRMSDGALQVQMGCGEWISLEEIVRDFIEWFDQAPDRERERQEYAEWENDQ